MLKVLDFRGRLTGTSRSFLTRSLRSHMTFPIEISRRLDLQLGSLDIPVDATAALQDKQVLYLDSTAHLAHNVGLPTDDVAFHNAIGPYDNFRRAVDITRQVPVDAQVPIAGNVSFH